MRRTPRTIAEQIVDEFDADCGNGMSGDDMNTLIDRITAAIETDRAHVESTPDVIPDRIAGSQDGIGNVGG